MPECKLLFRSKGSSLNSDYHDEINGDSFREWFTEKLLLSPEESCKVKEIEDRLDFYIIIGI